MSRRHDRAGRPFLALCLSMVFISVASEAAHFTDGRLSLTGSLALMGIAAGLLLYCVFFAASRAVCERVKRYFPLICAALCLCMALPIGRTPISALYGVSCGLFLAGAVTGYLPHAGTSRRMLKIGLSAGIYTTAVYPFGIAYTLLASRVSPVVMRIGTFALLAALAVVCYILYAPPKNLPSSAPAPVKLRPVMLLMGLAVVALAVFNHLLNSGVLEQRGGTMSAPLIFFVNVILRLPMGVFMGYLADRGRWQIAVGLPLSLMVSGCAVSLFAGGAAGDYAMLSAFNCGGAAIVMLIHILGMQTATWRNGSAFAACFGSLTHFVLVAFFNINTLGLSPEFFGDTLRRPLTLAVIIAALPTFWLILEFLANERLRESMRAFFVTHPQRAERVAAPESGGAARYEFTQREADVALQLTEGKTRRDIARKLSLGVSDVDRVISAIRGKVSGLDEPDAYAAIAEKYGLTRRETDMLRGLRRSMTNAEIAAELFLSEETVKIHVRNLMRKLPVETRQDVAAWPESLSGYPPS
jgi:DNA-binding NarL/FixJ family response regulator